MSRAIASMWFIVVAVALTGPIASWRMFASARTTAQSQVRRLGSIEAKSAEIKQLRSQSPVTPSVERDAAGLAPRLTQSLAAAGIPPNSLASLTPQNETIRTPDGKQAVRRRAAVTLAPVRLPDLGAFIDAWRRQNPEAIISSIDLSPENGASAPPGGDLPLRVVMTIESVAVETAGGAP